MDKNRTSTVPIVPKQYRLPFFMLVSCFALWGLLNNMTDNLVPDASQAAPHDDGALCLPHRANKRPHRPKAVQEAYISGISAFVNG